MKNFVIFASPFDYHSYSYSEVNELDNVEYITRSIHSNNKLINFLFKLHCSRKTNKYLRIPFKCIWFDQLSKFKFKKDIVFIFFAGTIRFNLIKDGYISYLKKKFPNSKFVCFYQDLIKFHNIEINIDFIKNQFDYVYSFDHKDCEQYGLDYHQLVYSNTFATNDEKIVNDVYFVGLAKNRLNEILNAYERLKEKGLKCDFHIVGVKKEDRKYDGEIDYCDNVSYSQNLEYISKTKAILEIMQKNGYGFTLRTCEAIMFDKMLITNNCTIKNAEFYSNNNIISIDDIESIDWTYLKSNNIFNHKYKNKLSPRLFLQEISERIENHI